MNAPRLLVVPGWRSGGPAHWQGLWAEGLPGATTLEVGQWVFPRREAWVEPLAAHLLAHRHQPVVVVAHHIGCIATAHLPAEAAACISGALLVAPADPDRRSVLADFAPVPHQKLPYRSVLVASSNDPHCPVRLAGAYARAWGSELVRLDSAGPESTGADAGEWPLGVQLLSQLGVALGAARRSPKQA